MSATSPPAATISRTRAPVPNGTRSDERDVSCKKVSDTALTVVAGPVNYAGVNPKVKCSVPQPSR